MNRLSSSVVELRSYWPVMLGTILISFASLITSLVPLPSYLFLTDRSGYLCYTGDSTSIVLLMERLRPGVASCGNFRAASPDYLTKFCLIGGTCGFTPIAGIGFRMFAMGDRITD